MAKHLCTAVALWLSVITLGFSNGTIKGNVWNDLNNNSLQDAGELPMGSIWVQIETSSGGWVNGGLTGMDGIYSFSVPAGSYKVKIANPGNGFNAVSPNVGSNDAVDSDVDLYGFSTVFSLADGQTVDLDGGFTTGGQCYTPVTATASNVTCNGSTFSFQITATGGTMFGGVSWGWDYVEGGLSMQPYGSPVTVGPFPCGSPKTVTIKDVDNPFCTATVTVQSPACCGGGGVPSLTINDVTVNEPAGTATLQICASATSSSPMTVQFASSNGTAASGSDYTTTSGTATIPAGQTCTNIVIPIVDDNVAEPTELFNVNLSTPTGATIADPLGTVTILDNDQPGGVDCNAISISVSGSSIVITGLTAPVTMIQAFNSAWATVFNQIYTSPPGSVTIPNLANGTYFVKVNFLTAAWSPICQKEVFVTVPGGNLPTLNINDVTVTEGTNPTASLQICASATSSSPITVQYSTSNGTAIAGTDYTTTSGTATIPAGQTCTTVTFPILDDNINEPTEIFNVNLTNPSGATVADPLGTVTILDNDQAPPQLGSIGDLVWNDSDQDGVKDPNEQGVSGVSVQLKDCNGATLQTAQTNNAGNYNFPNLQAGCYRVCFSLLNGYQFSPINQGNNDSNDSDVNPADGCTNIINLQPGQNDPTQDAGIFQPPTPTPPIITCKNVVSTITSGTSGKVSYMIPTATTTCAAGGLDVERISGLASGSNFPVGSTEVCYRATDACGGSTSCCFTVTVSVCPQSPTQYCYTSPTVPNVVNAKINVTDNGSSYTIRTTFAKTFVDNTYGSNAIGWPGSGHTFNNLVGSDKLQLALYNGAGTRVLEFEQDYISASGSAPSGYDCLGVTGGEGKMVFGSATNVLSATTSLDVNLNQFGYVLTTNSPATNANYTPNPQYPNWIFDVWYEVTVAKSVFGATGIGTPVITSVHASPSKTGNNTEPVNLTTCPPAPQCGPITLTCPTNMTAATSGTSAVVNYSTPTGTTTCAAGGLNIARIGGPASGTAFPVGTTTVCHLAMDACGNVQECCFTVTVSNQPPQQLCNCNGAKIAAVRMLYNGKDCSAGNNSQGGKATCTGSIGTAGAASIKVGSAAGGSQWFSGTVSLGQTFLVSASNGGATKLGADSYYTIGGQTGKFHTSCSQPIGIGDQYGGMLILGIRFDNGTTCGDMGGTPPNPGAVVSGGTCTGCDAAMWVTFNSGCQSVIVSSCKDISNVVLRTANGVETKFDNQNGTTKTYTSPNGSPITTVWVKSGCFKSGDGPGYGRKFANPLNCTSGAVVASESLVFNAYKIGTAAKLSWVSNTGERNDFAVIERSANGSNWSPLQKLDAKGAVQELLYFSEMDFNPLPSDNFYRIRMVYLDGTESFSKTEKLTFAAATQLAVFPNPAANEAWLSLPEFEGKPASIQILDLTGKMERRIEVSEVGNQPILLPLHDLESGFFILQVESVGVRRAVKLVVSQSK